MVCGKNRFETRSERERQLWMKRGDATEEVEMTEAEGKREKSEVG